MPPTGSVDLHETFTEWFAITTKVLQTKIAKLGIRSSGELYNSIDFDVPGSSEFEDRGYIIYNLYGKFVDIGVGRGFAHGNSGRVKSARKRKEWYSKLFYAQVMRLREISAAKFGSEAARSIVMQIEAVKDLKYQSAGTQTNSRKLTLLPPN